MLKGHHDPGFGFTRCACRSPVTIVKTNDMGYFSFVERGARFSQVRVVLSYDEPTPTYETGFVLERDCH
jgi:hypothetical protein